MKSYISKQYWAIPTFAILGLLCGLIYCKLGKPLYEVSGSIGIMRPSLPPVTNFMPETQNRWVWIRDGLSIKNMLLQDSIIHNLITSSEVLTERFEAYATKFPKMQQDDMLSNYINVLKKSIKIQYTGGDANVFILTVTDNDPSLAKKIVNRLMIQLKSLFEDVMFKHNDESLQELHARTLLLKQDKSKNGLQQSRIAMADDAEAKLYVENILQNIQSKMLVKTISTPYVPTHPIWPRWDLLIFFSTFTGLLIGIVFYYLVSRINE